MSADLAKRQPAGPSAPAGRPSKLSLAFAFLVAAVSDVVSYGTAFVPPMQWTVDLVTALLLFVLLGRRWAILPGLVAEAIPGVAVFPVWMLVVVSVALWGEIKRSGPLSRQ
jgi:DNA-binding transcriptional LysR family regulator